MPTNPVYELSFPPGSGRAIQSAGNLGFRFRTLRRNSFPARGRSGHHFDLNLTLVGGLPIKDLSSWLPQNFHQIFHANRSGNRAGPVRGLWEQPGFILRYRLDGQKIQSGLLLFEGEKENFFLLQVPPPRRVAGEIPGRSYSSSSISPGPCTNPLGKSKKLVEN